MNGDGDNRTLNASSDKLTLQETQTANEILGTPGGERLSDPDVMNQFLREDMEDIRAIRRDLQNVISDDFKKSRDNERRLQLFVGYSLVSVFIGEVLVGAAVLVLFGLAVFSFPDWVATAFFVSGLAHATYLVQKIVSHLFNGVPANGLMEKVSERIRWSRDR